MHRAIRITDVHLVHAPNADTRAGLLGWVSCKLNGCVGLDGIALRQTRAGHLTLSFPERRDSAGRRHPLIRPLDSRTREAIEGQILGALEEMGVMP